MNEQEEISAETGTTGEHREASATASPTIFPTDGSLDVPARRFNLAVEETPGFPRKIISFTIPAGVSTETGLENIRRSQVAILRGGSRRVVNIDWAPGKPRWRVTADGFVRIPQPFPVVSWIKWALAVVRSYVDQWATKAYRATLGRRAVAAQLAAIDAAILSALSKQA